MANALYNFVKKNNISRRIFIAYVVGFAVICYFLFFAFFGPKGLLTLFKLNEEISGHKLEQEQLIKKREQKKNMVKGMSKESLDLDLLDEQSRRVLGYVGKNEIVIYKEDKNQKTDKK